jgi:hypothetical protein
MTSYSQIEANRRNALKSTGPKTETGKRATPDGYFSLLIASVADEVVALDVSSLAIERTRSLSAGANGIRKYLQTIMSTINPIQT